jgi:hypothetical protein
MTKMILTAYF